MLNPALERFDIRNFAEQLIPKRSKNRYQCPACEDGVLTINPDNGAYQCWGSCPPESIRESIRPIREALAEIGIEKKDFVPKKHIPKQKPVINPAPIPDGVIKLAVLPQSVTEEARVRLGSTIEIKYPYSSTQWVNRTEYPNGEKTTLPYHINSNGETVNRKGDQEWPSYRFDEIVKYGAGQWVLGVEGEKVTDIARSIFGFLTTTFQGSSWSQDALDKYFQTFKDAGVIGFIYDPDHDKIGYAKSEKCKLAAAKAGLPFIALDPIRLWADCPSGGDIADWVKAGLASSEALHQEINRIADELRLTKPQPQPQPQPETTTVSDFENWVKSRDFSPNIIMSDPYFKFPELPLNNALISVKASLGKGKTNAIIEQMKKDKTPFHLIGYRNNLLFQTIARAAEMGLSIYHLNEDDAVSMLADMNTNFAFCLDSIHKTEGYFKGRDIILDESCSVLIHAIEGATLKDGQARAIRVFSQALKEANRVFLLDGNNSDLYTTFYHNLCPEKQLVKIENTFDTPVHSIKIIDSVKDDKVLRGDRSPLINYLISPDVIPWIYCDSKDRGNILETILTKHGKRGFCLNSESSAEDWAKEFLADPDKFILDKKPQFIIISPTAESGISVSLRGYFTDKFSIYAGVTSTNSQCQGMFRLRDESIPHYLFCPVESFVKDRNSPNTYAVKKFQEIINDRINLSVNLAAMSSNDHERANHVILSALSRQNDNFFNISSTLGCNDNYEQDNLRRCLVYALRNAGHNVEIISEDSIKAIREEELEAKEEVQKQHALEVFKAEEFGSVDEAKKAKKAGAKKDTQRRIEKTFLLDRLPDIKDCETWSAEFIYETFIHRKNYIRRIEMFWLAKHFDISAKRHESNWFYRATQEDYYTANKQNTGHEIVWALQELGIVEFIESGENYHKNSSCVLKIIDRIRADKNIRTALKLDDIPDKIDNIKLIDKLLSLLGYENYYEGKKYADTVRLSHYRVVPVGFVDELEEGHFDLLAAREEILKCVEKRFVTWFESEKSQINWTTPFDELPQEEKDIANCVELIKLALEDTSNTITAYETIKDITKALNKYAKKAAFNRLPLHQQLLIKQLKKEYDNFSQVAA
jgi:hypothetical protein